MTFDLPYAAPSMMDPTIFIVDDDAGVRDSLSLLLGLRGYRVQVFERAGDFLSVVRAESYGCALFDIRMQGMGGGWNCSTRSRRARSGCRSFS